VAAVDAPAAAAVVVTAVAVVPATKLRYE
jgi:hypothetical protein